jgi:hypothetical protein
MTYQLIRIYMDAKYFQESVISLVNIFDSLGFNINTLNAKYVCFAKNKIVL